MDNGHGRALASKLVTQFRLGVPADKQKFQAELGLLKRDQRSNGGWGKDDSPKSDLETTYRVMRCFMMLKERPAHVDALVNFIHKCRNEDHGYAVAPGQNSSISGVYYAAIIMHWLDDKK